MVLDADERNDDTFQHGAVAAVARGERRCDVLRQSVLFLEALQQQEIADEKTVDQIVKDFREFMSHRGSFRGAGTGMSDRWGGKEFCEW